MRVVEEESSLRWFALFLTVLQFFVCAVVAVTRPPGYVGTYLTFSGTQLDSNSRSLALEIDVISLSYAEHKSPAGFSLKISTGANRGETD